MDLNVIIATLNENSGTINAVAILILVILTGYYAYSTHKLVKIEEEREKGKQRKFLNILLAEFKTNKDFLEYLKKELENRSHSRIERPLTVVFLGFRDDGWNTFRNQGGFQYIEEALYDKIAKYYVSLYKISKEQEIMRDLYFKNRLSEELSLGSFYDLLLPKIQKIEKEHDILQLEIKRTLYKTV
jgi:hypothetical protein